MGYFLSLTVNFSSAILARANFACFSSASCCFWMSSPPMLDWILPARSAASKT
jgi:hypothetical protein